MERSGPPTEDSKVDGCTRVWHTNSVSEPGKPTSVRAIGAGAVDLGFRTAYRTAHRMLRAYWRFRQPRTRGALIAVWHDGQVLLVKNSYRREYTLPGGYVRADETPEQGAARELREEVGIDVSARQLRLAYAQTKSYENRQDHVTICSIELEHPVEFKVDNREVVWAGFRHPVEALSLPVVPHLREYLEPFVPEKT